MISAFSRPPPAPRDRAVLVILIVQNVVYGARVALEAAMCVAAVMFMLMGFVIFGALALIGDLPRRMGRAAAPRDWVGEGRT